jgi:iron complex transport system substrate-binding protein
LLGDIWYAPVGDSYVAQLIKDAGGSYVYKDSKGTGSLALSIETILKDNANTEIWINPGIETKAKVLKMNPHAKHLNCFNNMYCYSTNMNKFWEQSASQPNLFLSDLIHVFHPEIKEIKQFTFYKKIN